MSASQLEVRRTLVAGSRPGPAPEKFFETLTAYQHTATLSAASSSICSLRLGRDTRSLLANRCIRGQRADPLLVFEV